MNRYWYKSCPRCDGQGRLFIHCDSATGKPYLHCEECEYGFHDPLHSDSASDGFLAIDVDYVIPSRSEIETKGWGVFASHEDVVIDRHEQVFAIGQRVNVILNERNRTPHDGTIRAAIWHHKYKRFYYYLEERGRSVSKRYAAEDLQPVE